MSSHSPSYYFRLSTALQIISASMEAITERINSFIGFTSLWVITKGIGSYVVSLCFYTTIDRHNGYFNFHRYAHLGGTNYTLIPIRYFALVAS